jgi:hypothetical protein
LKSGEVTYVPNLFADRNLAVSLRITGTQLSKGTASVKRVLVIINKWWECDPALASMLNDFPVASTLHQF